MSESTVKRTVSECEKPDSRGTGHKPTAHAPTWLGVQPARVQEFGGEVDVYITEEEKDVASLPEAGSDIEPLSPRKLPVQLDEGEVPEVGSPRRDRGHGQLRAHTSRPAAARGKSGSDRAHLFLPMFLL